MSKRLIALLAGVMAIAIIAAGCGSSSDDSTDTTVVVLTKTEFIKQGDAICAKGGKASPRKPKTSPTKTTSTSASRPRSSRKN